MPAEGTVLERVKSCSSVGCLLRLQPSELIASESEGDTRKNGHIKDGFLLRKSVRGRP